MKRYLKVVAVYLTGTLLSPYLFLQWLRIIREGKVCSLDAYIRVTSRYFLRFFRMPNLIRPQDYNEKITWLKLFDHNMLKVECCDKYDARKYIVNKVGEKFLPDNYYVGHDFDRQLAKTINHPFVIKTTHDQGGVYFCTGDENIEEIEKDVTSRLKKRYGFINYEWPYLMLNGKVVYEEYLNYGGRIPDDYKFHCANGEVKWLQYITDRGIDTKEGIYDLEGNKLDQVLDADMKRFCGKLAVDFKLFQKMISLAEMLASEFKYVRVDMYCIGEKINIGELTFFPLGGLYKSKDVDFFGNLIDFDTSSGYKNNLDEK
ncbi:MAG: ATP-grasp fold amidoligase family protein [Candidatus Thiodiazotropha lotti]